MKPSAFLLNLTTIFLIMGLGWIFWHKDLEFGGTLTAIGIVFLILTVISFVRERSEDRPHP